MRSSEVAETIFDLHGVLRNILITGIPGGGKTSIVKQVAERLGKPVILKHLPSMLIEDFAVPDMGHDGPTFGYKLNDWFPYQGKPGTENGGILLFDDRSQADATLQKVLAHILLERELHGHKLADGWQIISTGNRQQDRAGANRTLSHLSDRESLLEYETNLDDWCEYAFKKNLNPMIIAFLRFRPGLLHDFDANREKNATPRGWEAVSTMLPYLKPSTEYAVIKGTVGEGAAAEFTGFCKIYRSLPNPDAVLLDPKNSDVPTDPATLYALTGALASRASATNFERVVTYVSRMPPEFSVLAVKMSCGRDKALTSSPAFQRWAVEHKEVLF
jgi:hypothetical protein